MHEVTTRSILIHTNGFCSQKRTPLPPVRTIEEGVEIIEKILFKEVLCRHDLEEINQVYQAIDLLEHQVNIPERSSQSALQKIIDKTEVAAWHTVDARDLISQYHLRKIADKDLQALFKARFVGTAKQPEKAKDIAFYLPYCLSTKKFNKDVLQLIGENPPEQALKILNRKREKLENHEQLKQLVQEKKAKLELLRKGDPQKYPAYFDELLENGYIYLYDHLVKMREARIRNERQSEVADMTFSSLSQVVLETREAIMRKVESSIPHHSSNIVFLLGGSGAGKSTTLCYLRGDKMKLKDFNYSSEKDDQIIGHEGAVSCTFLPTAEVVNDIVIVDIPGFDDTNGQLISLGMEFALKALIKKYHPKVLVLEAITNNHGRYAAVAQLGRRLARLLDNKEDGILGITKYTQEPSCKEIAFIEKEQRRSQDKPTEEEEDLRAEIRVLTRKKPNDPEIQELQQKLDQLEQQRKQNSNIHLPETEEKQRLQAAVSEKEKEMLEQVGLGSILRFADLEDLTYLFSCLRELSNKKDVRVKPEQILDAHDQDLLEDRFEHQLLDEINTKEGYYNEFESVKAFEESVLGSSLVKTIFSQTNPEIGQLLHLPEISPRVVRGFDLKIVGSCIVKCMRTVITVLNITEYKALIEKAPTRSRKYRDRKTKEDLQRSLTELMKYVLGLAGERFKDATPKEIEDAWQRIQAEHQKVAASSVEKDYSLPTWAKIGLAVPFGVPYFIHKLLKNNAQANMTEDLLMTTIDNSCNGLDQMLNVLSTLKGIEKIITKQDEIDQVFKSSPISLTSLEQSILRKVNTIRKVYGDEEWDGRITNLKDKFFMHLKPSLKSTNYLALASLLLDESLSCIQSTVDLSSILQDIGQEEAAKNSYLLFGPRTILIKGKLSAALFEIEVNRMMKGKKVTSVDEKLSTDEQLLHGITQFTEEMDMRRPLFRTLLAGVVLHIFKDVKK